MVYRDMVRRVLFVDREYDINGLRDAKGSVHCSEGQRWSGQAGDGQPGLHRVEGAGQPGLGQGGGLGQV